MEGGVGGGWGLPAIPTRSRVGVSKEIYNYVVRRLKHRPYSFQRCKQNTDVSSNKNRNILSNL